ncbi:MAG: hypothetical protein ACOX87_11760 [Chloroflexota bacterium]
MGTSNEKVHIRSEGGASHDVAREKPSPKTPDSPNILELGIKPQVVDRLLPHLDSFVKWELLRFFHGNPEMAATVDELARYTGRDETELKPAARALSTAGIINQRDVGSGYEYSLTKDDTLRHLINHLIQRYQGDRLVRHAISNQILRTQRQASSVQLAT